MLGAGRNADEPIVRIRDIDARSQSVGIDDKPSPDENSSIAERRKSVPAISRSSRFEACQ